MIAIYYYIRRYNWCILIHYFISYSCKQWQTHLSRIGILSCSGRNRRDPVPHLSHLMQIERLRSTTRWHHLIFKENFIKKSCHQSDEGQDLSYSRRVGEDLYPSISHSNTLSSLAMPSLPTSLQASSLVTLSSPSPYHQ